MNRKKICDECSLPKNQRNSLSRICGICKAWQVIDGKWKLYIIWALQDGERRFLELEKIVEDISPKVLTEQLREMERDEIISRTIYEEIPLRVEYALTPLGKELLQIAEEMAEIGKQIPFPE